MNTFHPVVSNKSCKTNEISTINNMMMDVSHCQSNGSAQLSECSFVVLVVVVLFYVHSKQLRSYRGGQLTTFFLGRLRPPKRLISTLCTFFLQ